jgi:DNA-binding response OmpR family regulator
VPFVLVIEDSADLRDMYAEILAIGAHRVETAETAAEALTLIAAARPDVIVLDLGIAGGHDAVVEAIRGEPKVGLILASGARDLAERAADLGAAYLQKPFKPEQLLAAVEKAGGRR